MDRQLFDNGEKTITICFKDRSTKEQFKQFLTIVNDVLKKKPKPTSAPEPAPEPTPEPAPKETKIKKSNTSTSKENTKKNSNIQRNMMIAAGMGATGYGLKKIYEKIRRKQRKTQKQKKHP